VLSWYTISPRTSSPAGETSQKAEPQATIIRRLVEVVNGLSGSRLSSPGHCVGGQQAGQRGR
jgi:hypothetical protein